jgi:predicted metal-dependent phosphotriesterase family hydrolase
MRTYEEKNSSAITLTELLVVIAIVVTLLVLLFDFAGGGYRRKSKRIECVNNLKQLSLGSKLFAADNMGRFSWQIPVSEGGFFNPTNQKTYLLFLAFTNELGIQKSALAQLIRKNPLLKVGRHLITIIAVIL